MNAKQLTAARKALGISQNELSKLLFVDRTAVSKWESGINPIPPFLHLAIEHLSCGKRKR